MNRQDGFTTARQRRLEREEQREARRGIYLWADWIPGLTYAEKCHIRDAALQAHAWSVDSPARRDHRVLLNLFGGMPPIAALWAWEILLFRAGSLQGIGRAFGWHVPPGGLGDPILHQAACLLVIGVDYLVIIDPKDIVYGCREIFTRNEQMMPIAKILLSLVVFVSLGGTPWVILGFLRLPHVWIGGWAVFLALGLGLANMAARIVGLVTNRLDRIMRPAGELPHHLVIWRLFDDVTTLYAYGHVWRQRLGPTRRSLLSSARAIERSRIAMRTARWRDVGFRRDLRVPQLRLAALYRTHASALAKALDQAEYEAVCDSMRAGLLAAVDLDWTTLLANAPQVTGTSRAVGALRRFAPSLTLTFFALAIPLLPGVGDSVGSSIRVLLLGTAVLTLIPAGDGASATIKDALDKAVMPGSRGK